VVRDRPQHDAGRGTRPTGVKQWAKCGAGAQRHSEGVYTPPPSTVPRRLRVRLGGSNIYRTSDLGSLRYVNYNDLPISSQTLRRPALGVMDGNKGLRGAAEQNWHGVAVQRCTVHQLRNLERYVPRHALEEMRSDYHRIIRADCLDGATRAHREFISK